jgi:hypothetical protein
VQTTFVYLTLCTSQLWYQAGQNAPSHCSLCTSHHRLSRAHLLLCLSTAKTDREPWPLHHTPHGRLPSPAYGSVMLYNALERGRHEVVTYLPMFIFYLCLLLLHSLVGASPEHPGKWRCQTMNTIGLPPVLNTHTRTHTTSPIHTDRRINSQASLNIHTLAHTGQRINQTRQHTLLQAARATSPSPIRFRSLAAYMTPERETTGRAPR